MDRTANRGAAVTGAGLLLTVVGLVGYGAGVVVTYPGRAFAVTGIMVGITLLAIGNAMRPEGAT